MDPQTALETLRAHDSLVVVEAFAGMEPLAAAKAYADLQRDFYWKKKDPFAMVAVARAGIQHGLTLAYAFDTHEPDLAYQLRSVAKGMAYDLGSFTWIGWDEPDFPIGDEHRAIGYDAAKTNLRLAAELNKGDLPLSRAWWLVGAHAMAAGDLVKAKADFEKAAEYAVRVEKPDEDRLCRAYGRLAEYLATPEGAARAALEASIAEIGDAGLADQVSTAWRVFGE